MLLQTKKGLSVMIGYVLLVAIGIVMSIIVYGFIKTYVPTDPLECPEGVSVFIQNAKYDCEANTLEITLKNNGKFNVAGYFIHATTSAEQELATEDLSDKVANGGEIYSNSVLFSIGQNSLSPGDSKKTTFKEILEYYKIEIIPVRFQEEEGKTRFVSCGNARVEEALNCYTEPEVCIPDCS
ncbi:MAG: hypothetical protein PHU63_03865, partial [Candidatus ainarchaeum sp.]|nr:hypothetical protein [Candidatus ainarchaeum sp.]